MSSAAITTRFGAAVRNLRFRRGLSQEELAERADLHRTYIAGIEGGSRNVTLKSVAKLADALEVSTAELLAPAKRETSTPHGAAWKPASGKIVEILLVEDNPDDVALTLAAFRQVKIANRVHVVSDGAKALEYLFSPRLGAKRRLNHLPQLILLDLDLPKISGFDVLRRLRQDPRTRSIPVIVLTMSQADQDIAESRRLGADTYLVKPVDFYRFCQITPQLKYQWALFKPPDPVRG